MRHSSGRVRLRLLAFLLFLVLPAASALPARALAQTTSDSEQQLQTKYFTIFYPQGEKETADWYAGFADDVNVAVAEMLGQDPVTGLTLRIYTTEAAYITANPAAASEPGIMAHSIPSTKEVGVAVERLRQVGSDIARQSFRHEMTHIVAGALSDQNLPIGFQEALAQYNELSTSRAQESVGVLKSVVAANGTLLSWKELNDRGLFMGNAALGYPESYSVMSFLADKYGMGAFAHFMSGLRAGARWERALTDAYGKPVSQLETEWHAYLPGFLKDGWQQNLLAAYDLSPGVALYDAGQFKGAKEHFALSEKLYADLGRTERHTEAAGYLAKAEKAEAGADLAAQARKSLEAYDYSTAHEQASRAVQAFDELSLKTQSDIATETAALAQQGLDAITMLARAQDHLDRFDLPSARAEARFASQTFSQLGDAARTQEANKIVSSLSFAFTAAGAVVLALGLLALVAGGLVMLRSRRAQQATPILPGEESASWL
jgi:hypothetical protein